MRETFFLQNFLEGMLRKNTLNVKISRNDSKIRAKTRSVRNTSCRFLSFVLSLCPRDCGWCLWKPCRNPIPLVNFPLSFTSKYPHGYRHKSTLLLRLNSSPLVAMVRACFVSPGIPSRTWRRWRRLLRCWLRIQWQRWTTSLSSIGTRWDGMKTLMAGYRPNMKHVWS